MGERRGGGRDDGPLVRGLAEPTWPVDVQDNHVDIDTSQVSGQIRICKGGDPGGWTISGVRAQGRTIERMERDGEAMLLWGCVALGAVLGFGAGLIVSGLLWGAS